MNWWRRLSSTRDESAPRDGDLVNVEARAGISSPLNHLSLQDQRLVEADFSGRKLDSISVSYSTLERCRFERIRVSQSVSLGAGILPSRYIECSFDGSRFRSGSWGRAQFTRCSFRDVLLREMLSFEAEFVGCVFSGRGQMMVFNGRPAENLQSLKALHDAVPVLDQASETDWQARFKHAQRATGQDSPDRATNQFFDNDFSQMDLVDVAFRTGIDLTRQKLPSGPEYHLLLDARPALIRARSEVSRWPEGDDFRGALALVSVWLEDVYNGQAQLLLRRGDIDISKAARDELWRLLTAP